MDSSSDKCIKVCQLILGILVTVIFSILTHQNQLKLNDINDSQNSQLKLLINQNGLLVNLSSSQLMSLIIQNNQLSVMSVQNEFLLNLTRSQQLTLESQNQQLVILNGQTGILQSITNINNVNTNNIKMINAYSVFSNSDNIEDWASSDQIHCKFMIRFKYTVIVTQITSISYPRTSGEMRTIINHPCYSCNGSYVTLILMANMSMTNHCSNLTMIGGTCCRGDSDYPTNEYTTQCRSYDDSQFANAGFALPDVESRLSCMRFN